MLVSLTSEAFLPWFESAWSTRFFASTIASASHCVEVSTQRLRIGRSGVAGDTLTSPAAQNPNEKLTLGP
jgi:hypothetical protein